MAAITGQSGTIHCIEGVAITIEAGMVQCDSLTHTNFEINTINLTRCTRVDDTHILPDRNPSQYDCSFEIRLYDGFMDYTEWYWVYLTMLPSLTRVGLTISQIRTALGDSSYALGVLNQSSSINQYSVSKPDKIAPHGFGEFHEYTPGALGGIACSPWMSNSVAYASSITPRAYVHQHPLPKYSFGNATLRMYDVDGAGYQEQAISWTGGSTYKVITFNPINWVYERRGASYTYRFVVAYNDNGTMREDNVSSDVELAYGNSDYYLTIVSYPGLDVAETTIDVVVNIENQTTAQEFTWRVWYVLAGIGTVYETDTTPVIQQGNSLTRTLYHIEDYPISSSTAWGIQIYWNSAWETLYTGTGLEMEA